MEGVYTVQRHDSRKSVTGYGADAVDQSGNTHDGGVVAGVDIRNAGEPQHSKQLVVHAGASEAQLENGHDDIRSP